MNAKNKYESYGSVSRIFINKGCHVIIDTEDIPRLSDMHWHTHKGMRFTTTYCRGSKWINGKVKGVMIHRVIMNAKPGQDVDHINHDGLDNRKCNLRLCSHNDNCKNRIKSKNKTSTYKGVSRDTRRRKREWIANIYHGGKLVGIGCYLTEIEAAKAYNLEAQKVFGDFACLNVLP